MRTCAGRPRSRPLSTPMATSRSAISPVRWPNLTPSAAGPWSALHVGADRRPGLGSWGVYRLQLGLGAGGRGGGALVLAAGMGPFHDRPDGPHRLDVAGVRLPYPAVN